MTMKKPLFWFVVAANLAGAAYGFIFFYGEALLSTPLHLIVFVPDCPLYSLLFAAALLLTRYGKEQRWFNYIVAASALKYGFWTVFVLASYPWFYFSGAMAITYAVLLVAHIGLFVEQVLLVGHAKPTKAIVAAAFAWLLLNDYADYVLNLHPPLPHSEVGSVFIYTIAMTFAFTAVSALLFSRLKKPILDIFY